MVSGSSPASSTEAVGQASTSAIRAPPSRSSTSRSASSASPAARAIVFKPLTTSTSSCASRTSARRARARLRGAGRARRGTAADDRLVPDAQACAHLMRILVTGGRGFLGSHVDRALREAGHDVVVLGRADGDLAEAGEADRLVAEHAPDAVVHLAAVMPGDERLSQNAPITALVAAACRARGIPLYHGSSTAVNADDTPYAASKRASEEAAAGATMLRFHYPYGPGQRRGAIPTMLRQALAGEDVVGLSRLGALVLLRGRRRRRRSARSSSGASAACGRWAGRRPAAARRRRASRLCGRGRRPRPGPGGRTARRSRAGARCLRRVRAAHARLGADGRARGRDAPDARLGSIGAA